MLRSIVSPGRTDCLLAIEGVKLRNDRRNFCREIRKFQVCREFHVREFHLRVLWVVWIVNLLKYLCEFHLRVLWVVWIVNLLKYLCTRGDSLKIPFIWFLTQFLIIFPSAGYDVQVLPYIIRWPTSPIVIRPLAIKAHTSPILIALAIFY